MWTRTQHYPPLDRKRCQPQGKCGGNEEGVSKLSSTESGWLWNWTMRLGGRSNGRTTPPVFLVYWLGFVVDRPNLTMSQIRRMFTFLSTVSLSDPAGVTGPWRQEPRFLLACCSVLAAPPADLPPHCSQQRETGGKGVASPSPFKHKSPSCTWHSC